jgi:tetratricopeptide (TPR) repeat protein
MILMARNIVITVFYILLAGASARAGLYYSGEKYASLPTQWRGFLLDHRTLRNIAVKPKNDADASPLRVRYLAEAKALQARLDQGKLDADEIADLGALYIRLGEIERAVEILRPAQRMHGNHFAIAANLGTAWQMLGDYRQAASSLEEAVRLAPGKHLALEQAHLKIVRGRQRAEAGGLDDLFGVRYFDDKGDYEPGKFAAEQKKKLPAKAVEITQRLALMFPADGPLLWQLAELANAHGDFPNAAAMMEGCVAQFGMANPTLKKHRQILRAAVDDLPAAKLGAEHENKHAGTIAFRSRRPLISQSLAGALPAIDPKGINPVPWELFGETAIEKPFKVSFPKYLQELNGKQVALTGFMYPLGEDPDMATFLFIEAPVGCWYCEMPETTGIIHVELPPGQTARLQRGLVRIVGRLSLNGDDAEGFLYAVRDARVGALD